MPSAFEYIETVPVSRLFLSLVNPRHERLPSEAKAIAFLCEKEDVYPLARDIKNHGLNPLERFALIPTDKRKTLTNPSYFVAEGNRRICALKLLNDPELAPAAQRKSFAKLAEDWTPIKTVPAVLFEDVESAQLWLDRIHQGTQGGIGRREWNSEQKARAHGGNKNKAAQALLDYAEFEKIISSEDRVGKLTTVQRFLTNDVFREGIGFDQNDPDGPGRTRPKPEFDLLLKRFVNDLVGKTAVTSRMNKDEIIKYARSLNSMTGITAARVESEPLSAASVAGKPPKSRHRPPQKPEKAKHVQHESDIAIALKALGNGKLESLYHSICTVDLDPHTPLVAVGVWSFFETLTACAGRNSSTSFDSFLGKNKLQSYGLSGGTSSLQQVMTRISEYGNTTKHHPVSATFNGEQLNNDMVALKPIIIKCIEEATSKKS